MSMHRVQYTEAIRIHGRHLVCSHESIKFRIRIFGHLCGGSWNDFFIIKCLEE